ncbi:hypothetical protein F6R98_13105 [Candidatus Methylospira mobilis]|uniref:DUF732 domain-containing protein n=1 Tax=Candidatus Methylospira mobilis TaxID=1808979 RepID=A0A5Q0BMG9_9GAMM|nr:hypothetical protein [Candidatus Methylospira mobilis]QFY43441.1 hypothetical protein F6R98_13105 [Candidatus Methylospira mobilis]WNV03320.1 hypothetical protein RP726_12730 [Candidatus Methylospira mobilis]
MQSKKTVYIAAALLSIGTLWCSSASANKPVTEEEHQAFVKKYTEMCIKREHKNKGSVVTSEDVAMNQLCECVARDESKHLTAEEVRKFVNQNEYPVSLMIKADSAAYHCTHPQ